MSDLEQKYAFTQTPERRHLLRDAVVVGIASTALLGVAKATDNGDKLPIVGDTKRIVHDQFIVPVAGKVFELGDSIGFFGSSPEPLEPQAPTPISPAAPQGGIPLSRSDIS